MRWYIGMLLLVLVGSFPTAQAADEAYFSASNLSPLIGEPVSLVLHVHIPHNAHLHVPEFAETWSGITIVDIGESKVIRQFDDGTVENVLPITIVLWHTGNVVLPPIALSYQIDEAAPVELQTQSLQFTVPATLDLNDLSLRPIKPPVGSTYTPLWVWGLLVVAIAVGLFFALGRSRNLRRVVEHQRQMKGFRPSNTPNVLNTLNELVGSTLTAPMIYQQVSDCLRLYLTEQLNIPAHDLTTNEIMSLLKKEQKLSETQHQSLYDMLRYADMVKFAHLTPRAKNGQQFATVALQWIRSVEQSLGRTV